MSKKSKAANKIKRLNEKRKKKAAKRALYESYKLQGANAKVKKKARQLRDWNQSGARPRATAPGTKPGATRRSTKEKEPWFGELKIALAAEKKARKLARQQENAK